MVGWLALAEGELDTNGVVSAGELVVFESSEASITLEATGSEDAVFVLGSAKPHDHALHLGNYSVHTSAEALETGERNIVDSVAGFVKRVTDVPQPEIFQYFVEQKRPAGAIECRVTRRAKSLLYVGLRPTNFSASRSCLNASVRKSIKTRVLPGNNLRDG